MNEINDTFAYVLLACPWTSQIESEMDEWYYGDIIEGFITAEDHAVCPESLWPFEWEGALARVSPVQLVCRWDPRPFIVSALGRAGFGTRPVRAATWTEANIIYFSEAPPAPDGPTVPVTPAPLSQDELRLEFILAETLRRALKAQQGILFVGGWGWSYEKNEIQGTQTVLRSSGMVFVTRHA